MSNWLSPEHRPGLITVIVPTYNRSALVGETLASLLSQDCAHLEVLLVDDGSSDDTVGTAAVWERRFNARAGRSMRLLRQDHQGGQAARNLGAARSQGEFISFLDDDDMVSANWFSGLLAAARAEGAQMACGPWTYFLHDEAGYGVRSAQGGQPRRDELHSLEDWLRGWSFYVPGSLISRSHLERTGPWKPDLPVCQDLEFGARCLAPNPRIAHCPTGMLYRRWHRGSVSHRSFSAYEDAILTFVQAIEAIALRSLPPDCARKALAQHLGEHATRFYSRGSRRGAFFCARKALEHDPDYRPGGAGLTSRLAFALGGFRLWAAKNRWRAKLKGWGRRIRDKEQGFTRVPALQGVDLSEGRDA